MAKCELAQRLQSDIVAAMKAKEKEKLGILRMLQAAVKQVEVDERRELDDADVTKIIATYAPKVKDQIKSYGEGGRDDLRVQAEKELEIVSVYLPEEMGDEELEQVVRATIDEMGAAGPQDMGKVMKAVMPKTAGRADGSRVSALVKKALLG